MGRAYSKHDHKNDCGEHIELNYIFNFHQNLKQMRFVLNEASKQFIIR